MTHFSDEPAMTTFIRYIKADPETEGRPMEYAAVVEERALEYVKKYWALKDVIVGDYILLQPNGSGVIMSKTNFEAKYVKAHTVVEDKNG